MEEEKFNIEQISMITGIPDQDLRLMRRRKGLPWPPGGYFTAQEVRQILGPEIQIRTPGEIGARRRKALRLAELLANLP